jgi:DNA-directed RNA polymerase specialized sigma24 family protein
MESASGKRFRANGGRDPWIEDTRALVAAIRARDERAATHFVEFYTPLLMDAAARLGIDRGERESRVLSFLGDHLMKLLVSNREPPRSLAGFLITSFSNQLIDDDRKRRVEERALERAIEVTVGDERVIPQSVSAERQRASECRGDDEYPLPLILRRLVAAMEEGLSPESRMLLSFMAKEHPHPRIAEWLGINVKAASRRIERLYRQCFERAIAFGNSLPYAERKELRGHFDRWAVTYAIDDADGQIVNAAPAPRQRR